ncbi:radical SAM protein [Crenobacter sp. SG2303]|uniref:Radical SAM protein n=1 Tax=Crenobacter oryzisoli TaxID=3056844 RepID=A0ABT7XJQ4_9NEIS|nr:radical SAM protein [Crenobacter sp. SG2303]MDN0074029.1 radical SAM protein [Crenobacter sp. SG2303]
MAYVVALLATRWGSELGGLNVFNRGLAEGMTQALPKGSQTICFVNRLPEDTGGSAGAVELVEHETFTATSLADDIETRCKALEPETLQGVLVVGHDTITGQVAIDCANALRTHLGSEIDVKSAVIGHMDYSAYAFMKDLSLEKVAERSAKQRDIIAAADCAFAVGPLLQRNFASVRSATHRPRSPVRPLVPGVDKVRLQTHDPRVDLQVFISGRLNREDDPIKNSILAVYALAAAYAQGRESNSEAWVARGQLFAWGVDPQSDQDLIEQLKEIGNKDAAFVLHPEPFSDDQAALRQRLASCHLALMPSWHEGFGLSGWEALCAGVPLVCSRQSGLAMLLDELKQQFPEVPFGSVEFVNIGGGTAACTPNPEDIGKFANVLLDMTANIEARKQAAIDLASLLKREFSWKRCASDLLEGTGWYLPGSVHWSNRQVAGQKQEESRQVLERILDNLDKLDLEEDWGDLTTAFNNLSDAGKNADLRDRAELREKLHAIGRAIGDRMAVVGPFGETARESGRMDVCWRFMAACANICKSFREFSQSFPEAMLKVIWNDTFLTKELFYYAAAFAKEFSHQASEIAPKFFAPVQLSGETASFSIRLARLASRHPELAQLFPKLESDPTFVEELTRCTNVARHAHDIAQSIVGNPGLSSTALALMALGPEPARQVADQTVAFFRSYYPGAGAVKGHWRGDKRVFAAFATASLPTNVILEVLRCMARDEDESIRWAALHLAFSRTLRRRLEVAADAGSLTVDTPLNQVLGNIVDTAVATDGGHPWLHREFLSHYLEERDSPPEVGVPTPLSVLDFPVARWLIGPVVGEAAPQLRGRTHPEVAITRTDTLQVVKRILLVLPPIEIDDDASGASRTSTPALGLGLLASHLAAEGHDVQVADCHRFPKLRTEVLRLAGTFDLIGFNTVFSTIRSTMKMLVDIRKRTQSTTLVIGGPAAKLNAWQFSTVHMEDAQASWDFAVSADAVENLSTLVASLKTPGPWPEAPGITANQQSWNVVGRGVSPSHNVSPIGLSQQPSLKPLPAWLHVVLDRRIYRNGDNQYEPARTRSKSSKFHEAHVVMSQGCDWNCVFCTERREKSGGEQRREVAHVLNEISDLASQHRDLRIQFIDDNLLPQIASNAKEGAAKYLGLAWASEFLKGLAEIKETAGDSFGWRGIFRLEDFFAYEAEFPNGDFIARLQRSGCRMLAFGVEHGSEEQRRKSKVASGVVGNDHITELFLRLRDADILTKAYFMLGGQWEDQESAQQTIDFAIQSGVTLAYFALYKDFSRATTVLSKEQQGEDPKAERFICYDQLILNWDRAFANAQDHHESVNGNCTMESGPITQTEIECYRELSALGFQFTDLVKYNDFHNEDTDGGTLLRDITWGSPSEYFKTVEQAYRQFYLRPRFVQEYSALLAHGY